MELVVHPHKESHSQPAGYKDVGGFKKDCLKQWRKRS